MYLETESGVGVDWHLQHKRAVIGERPWHSVVMHGYSTLDAKKPGDPGLLVASVHSMVDFLRLRRGGRSREMRGIFSRLRRRWFRTRGSAL